MIVAKHWENSRIEMKKDTEEMEKKEDIKRNLIEKKTSGEGK
jgi:hypothetical protein